MPGQGASPRPRKRGTGSPGALESYAFLALAAVDWLRDNNEMTSSVHSPPLLCAFGHSGGGLAALRAEQERPGAFRAVRRRKVFNCRLLAFFFSSLFFSYSLPPPSSLFHNTALSLRARRIASSSRRKSFSSREKPARKRGFDLVFFLASSSSSSSALLDAVARGRRPQAPQGVQLQGGRPGLSGQETAVLAVRRRVRADLRRGRDGR